jgi:hypothetical protein
MRHQFPLTLFYTQVLQAGYVLKPNCNTRWNQIRDSGRQFNDGKYKSHFDNLSPVGDWFKTMGDATNKLFGEDWARLTRDLLFNSEGSLKFKPGLLNDIRNVILPTLVDKVSRVPFVFGICVEAIHGPSYVPQVSYVPIPLSNTQTTQSISSLRTSLYQGRTSSLTSSPLKPTTLSNTHHAPLSLTSSTTSSHSRSGRCKLI